MESKLAAVVLCLILIAGLFSIVNFSNAQSTPPTGQSIGFYLKFLNARLIGGETSTSNIPSDAYPLSTALLPSGQKNFYEIETINNGTTAKLKVPIYSSNITPAYSSSRFIKFAATELFDICYPTAEAWDLRYDAVITTTPINNESLNSLSSKSVLKPGMLIGAYNPASGNNNQLDIKGNKAAYTHVLLYLGKNTSGQLLFSDLFADQIRIITEDNLLAQFTPIEILQKKGATYGVCSPPLAFTTTDSQQTQREKYYENLVEYIKVEESGRFGTGFRSYAKSAWQAVGGANSYGPYQMGYLNAKRLLSDPQALALFNGQNPGQITDSQIKSMLETPNGGKTFALALLHANEKMINTYTKLSPYLCPIPDYGTQERFALEASAYNAGVLMPLTAGFQYSLYKAGVNFDAIPADKSKFDGYIGKETANAIRNWTGGINIDLGTYNESKIFYPTALSKLLKNTAFMEKLHNAYKEKTGKDCVPLYMPYKDAYALSLSKGMNYGVRVAKSNQASQPAGNADNDPYQGDYIPE